MFGWPRDVHVAVILNPDGIELPPEHERPNGYELPFKLESEDLEVGSDNSLTFANKGRPGFLIHYHLEDPHSSGYVFPDDESEAMWSQEAASPDQIPCPNRTSHWPQFIGKDVKSGKKVLVVRNFNRKKAKFGYTLRVTQNPSLVPIKFAHLDPPGDNENGSIGFYSLTAETFVIAGAVATAVFAAVFTVGFVGDSNARLGIALLAALTVGFAAAALWERFRRS